MAKRGRIATPVELIQPNQCIEIDNQHIVRISAIYETTVRKVDHTGLVTGEDGIMLCTYRDQIQLFYPAHSLVDLVDESTLTHTPFD